MKKDREDVEDNNFFNSPTYQHISTVLAINTSTDQQLKTSASTQSPPQR
jgi:hypothetical protein